jgi:hypothetical protein
MKQLARPSAQAAPLARSNRSQEADK